MPVKASIFVLGPFIENVTEPFPLPVVATAAGRRQLGLQVPPTTPGGNVHLVLLPPLDPGDVLPLNVYAFFVQLNDGDLIPTDPDWYFKSGAPSGSIHIGAADADGRFTVAVTGVKPSLQPYFVQTILEFVAS